MPPKKNKKKPKAAANVVAEYSYDEEESPASLKARGNEHVAKDEHRAALVLFRRAIALKPSQDELHLCAAKSRSHDSTLSLPLLLAPSAQVPFQLLAVRARSQEL